VNQSAEKREDQRRYQSEAQISGEEEGSEVGFDGRRRQSMEQKGRATKNQMCAALFRFPFPSIGARERWPMALQNLQARDFLQARSAIFLHGPNLPHFRSRETPALAAMPTPLFPRGPNLPAPTPSPWLPRSCGVRLRPLGPKSRLGDEFQRKADAIACSVVARPTPSLGTRPDD
jgi:hypothetical protein